MKERTVVEINSCIMLLFCADYYTNVFKDLLKAAHEVEVKKLKEIEKIERKLQFPTAEEVALLVSKSTVLIVQCVISQFWIRHQLFCYTFFLCYLLKEINFIVVHV